MDKLMGFGCFQGSFHLFAMRSIALWYIAFGWDQHRNELNRAERTRKLKLCEKEGERKERLMWTVQRRAEHSVNLCDEIQYSIDTR